MTNDDKQVKASNEYDSDSLSPAIDDALADLLLPPWDDEIDLETAADALTDEDHKALAALGSPSELVARIVDAGEEATSRTTSQAGLSTKQQVCAASSTRLTGRRPRSDSTPARNKLLKRLQDFETIDFLSWNSMYRNKGRIGKGGQGIVFLIECINEHNLPKALKVFSPKPYDDVASYYEDMDRMAHVASLVYRMQLDNVVIIERCDYHDDISLMIMRWIDGHDLARLLEPSLLERLHGCVGEERWQHLNNVVVTTPGTIQLRLMPGMAVNVIEKCLRALAALHSNKIVHGDIKPSNIMLDRYGSIRLIDIGSAFELSAPPRKHTWTPRYAPPEIMEGEKWTPLGDLASLGYVLIELLSGQPAVASSEFGSTSTRELDATKYQPLLAEKKRLPERLVELLPANVQASKHLMNICRRLIDPDPRKRFASAEEALEGPDGTYQFLQGLTRMGLAVHYSQEIKRWLGDVKVALQ